MDVARLVLDYVEALKWPGVLVVLAVLYREPMGRLLVRLRPKSVKVPGGALEFFEDRVEVLSSAPLATVTTPPPPGSGPVGDGHPLSGSHLGLPPPGSAVGSLPTTTGIRDHLSETAERLLTRTRHTGPRAQVQQGLTALEDEMRRSFGITRWAERQKANAGQLTAAGIDPHLAADIAELWALGRRVVADRPSGLTSDAAENYTTAIAAALIRIANHLPAEGSAHR